MKVTNNINIGNLLENEPPKRNRYDWYRKNYGSECRVSREWREQTLENQRKLQMEQTFYKLYAISKFASIVGAFGLYYYTEHPAAIVSMLLCCVMGTKR